MSIRMGHRRPTTVFRSREYLLVQILLVLGRPAVLMCSGQSIRMSIPQGTLWGIASTTERGSQYFSFLGIPYAVPPVNELRFKDPIGHPGWSGEWLATEFGPPCPQWDTSTSTTVGQEDCLTLNVFTPQVPAVYPVEPLPVMFYVHGGGFLGGSSADYGAAKLLTESIVLVTVNYRQGVLGFASTQDEVLPGNYGMLDLVMALQWVRDNIERFGGDVQRVTIFGESAGAAAVSHLILSPLARGLFWAAIAQSGSALCDFALENNPLEYIRLVATSLGCDTANSRSIMACLLQKSPAEIVQAQQSKLTFVDAPVRTTPVVDKGLRHPPFLEDTPEKLLRNGDFSRVPLMSGVTLNEGLLFALRLLRQYAESLAFDPLLLDRSLLTEYIDAVTKSPHSDIQMTHLKNFYFKSARLDNLSEVIPPLVDMVSDIWINSCTDKAVKLYSQFAPTYMYVFSHRGRCTFADAIVDALREDGIQSPLFQTGVSHVDDLLYLFNMPNFRANVLSEDRRVQDIMILLWTTFARTGNPNMQSTSMNQESTFWPSLRPTDLVYFDINVYPHASKDYRQFELSVLDFIESMAPATPERYTNPEEPYFTVTWVLTAVCLLLLLVCIVLAVILIVRARKRGYSTDSFLR